MLKDKEISAIYLPNETPLRVGERVVQSEYAETLTYISQRGEAALYSRPASAMPRRLHEEEGRLHRAAEACPHALQGAGRAPADPRRLSRLANSGATAARGSGVHIAQMLNILEGYDIAKLGFGSATTIHYLAEVLKIAFADRAAASGDPDFINGAGRAADLEGLCRRTPPRARSKPCASVERRCAHSKARTLPT